jgi:hypothetical protein
MGELMALGLYNVAQPERISNATKDRNNENDLEKVVFMSFCQF